MSYFVDLYLPPNLLIDRDQIEEELIELDGFEVVGAGTGDAGSNLDLEVSSEVAADDAVRQVAEVLERLGVTTGVRINVT